MSVNHDLTQQSQTMSPHSSTVMPKRMPAYEKRERWMAVISASFQPITVFHFAKLRALDTVDLLDDLEAEIADMERRLEGFIPTGRLVWFWKGVYHMLKSMFHGYHDILTRLAKFEWTWWIHEDETTRLHLRAKKESMIKYLAVYDWVVSILQIAIKSSFEEVRPWFLTSWPTIRNVTASGRRSSCSEIDRSNTTAFAERATAEMDMLHWTQSLEGELRSTMHELQDQYDQGKVFEHYVHHLQWTLDKDRREWEEDRKENGEDDWEIWPLPDGSLKSEGLDAPGSKSQQRHSPVNGVPIWQEDEELQTIFS